MARKPKPMTPDELRKLKSDLLYNAGELNKHLAHCAKQFEVSDACAFDHAIEMRDTAQKLTATCHALLNIDDVIALAEHRGSYAVPFDLEACGM